MRCDRVRNENKRANLTIHNVFQVRVAEGTLTQFECKHTSHEKKPIDAIA